MDYGPRALTQLNEQSHETFESSTAVTEFMQQLLEQEREITVERDEVARNVKISKSKLSG